MKYTGLIYILALLAFTHCAKEEQKQVGITRIEEGKPHQYFAPVRWDKESSVTSVWNEKKGENVFLTYHENGAVKRSVAHEAMDGCQLLLHEIEYDTTGRKTVERKYKNYLPQGEEGCHNTRTVIKETEYTPNGTIAAIRFMKTCYECDQCACGWWKYYDEHGILESELPWGDCWDNEFNCLSD